MDKQYDVYLVLGSLIISFLTSFLAIAFANFIVWHKKSASQWWLFAAALNLGLGIWAMHFVGMLALHLDTAVAFEPIRTIVSALIPVAASYAAFWIILSHQYNSNFDRLLFGTFVLGSGIACMHYLGMDAMQMFPQIVYDPILFFLSLIIAYVASFIGLKFFSKSLETSNRTIFSISNIFSSMVIGVAVTGMHYTGMAAAEFDYNSYCTVLEEGIRFGNLALLVIVAIMSLLLFSFLILAYEQHVEQKEQAKNRLMLEHVTSEVARRTAELEYQTTMNERLLETMDAIVVVLDKNGFIKQFNLAAQHITGYATHEVKDRPVWETLIPQHLVADVKKRFSNLPSSLPNKWQYDLLIRQGGVVTIDWHNSVLLDENGEVLFIICTGLDITQAIKDQEALKLSAVAFETQEAMVVTDASGAVLKVNQAFEDITGYSLSEVKGKTMKVLQSGRHDKAFYRAMWACIINQGYWHGEIWNRRKNGEIYPEWLRITQVLGKDNQVINYIGSFADISQRKQIEQELEFLAFYDSITQLPNRRLFTDRLEQTVKANHSTKQHLALMFIDLDNFKHINDTFGHAFGDELLAVFSSFVKELVPNSVTLSRFGGDEFVILFTELSESYETAAFQIEHMAQIILDSLADGLDVRQQNVYISTSIGIAVSDCSKDDAGSLLMKADTAMYQAKAMGKNTFRFYTDLIGDNMAERFKMEVALRHDLTLTKEVNSPLSVVYQPQYNKDKKLIGAEALVRWNSAELGVISPVDFINVAEESGLIDDLGMFVVHRVLSDIQQMEWLFNESSLDHISINLSIKQLTNPNLTERLLLAFEEHQVLSSKVRFEFTESAFLDNALDPKALFAEMSEEGFSFSLDDFGTGFSSLSYLKDLPISELKIDKSFVDGIPSDDSDMTICSATISMAQKLGLEVVAEGVETQEQFDWLAQQGCNLLQGYLMSRPLPYAEFVLLLEK